MAKTIDLDDLLRRIEALEKVVFDTAREQKTKDQTSAKSEKFDGATGGVRLLISEGFFDTRRSFSEVERAMQENGYHYSKQAVQMPLSRLATVNGPLVALKNKGKNLYVKRK